MPQDQQPWPSPPGKDWGYGPVESMQAEIPPPPPTQRHRADPPSVQQPALSWDQHQWQQQQLQRELAAARDELQAMNELLEELPEIFERKFQGRMQNLLDEHHRLLRDNAGLREELLQMQTLLDDRQPQLLPEAHTDEISSPSRSRWSRLLPWLGQSEPSD